jgi:diguanylate cyclase
VYRLGGDEFAVLMPDTSLEHAFLEMEELRRKIMVLQEPSLPAGKGITVTIGVAQSPRDAKDGFTLIAAARAALANAKQGGRNQVGLTPTEESMVLKSCYYSASSLSKLKELAEKRKRKESQLLREALSDLLQKYDAPGAG